MITESQRKEYRNAIRSFLEVQIPTSDKYGLYSNYFDRWSLLMYMTGYLHEDRANFGEVMDIILEELNNYERSL